jgi:hypothetical protein
MQQAGVGFVAVAAMLALASPALVAAQPQPAIVDNFADLTDLTLNAPVILQATILRTDRLSRREAPDVPPGRVRMLVEAQVQVVLVSPDVVPARIEYLWEGPLDARGKAPKLKGAPVMLFLRRVPGREAQYQLTSPNSQIASGPRVESAVRRVLTDIRSPELRDLRITGVGNAFHVRGSIPGEAESQIFLTTASGRPVSLVVLARPNQPKSYSVALSDIIDDAAQSVPRDTLMWYKLACALPPTLPADAVDQLGEEDRRAVAADYSFVLASLGPCTRTLR